MMRFTAKLSLSLSLFLLTAAHIKCAWGGGRRAAAETRQEKFNCLLGCCGEDPRPFSLSLSLSLSLANIGHNFTVGLFNFPTNGFVGGFPPPPFPTLPPLLDTRSWAERAGARPRLLNSVLTGHERIMEETRTVTAILSPLPMKPGQTGGNIHLKNFNVVPSCL